MSGLRCGAQPCAGGPGVERITEEAIALFPAARRLVMASDTITGPQPPPAQRVPLLPATWI